MPIALPGGARHLLAAVLLATLAACGGGGGGASTPAGSNTTTPPPPEALKVYEILLPANIWADGTRKDASIALRATGGDGKNTWSVDCSPTLECSIADSVLSVVSRAQDSLSRATVTMTVTDGTGARASATQSVNAWPKAMTHGLQSVVGAVDRPGLHLLILGDGFSEAETSALQEIAVTFKEKFFRHPEIAAHRAAWNIHRIVVPPDADPANPAQTRSRFDAVIGCQGIDRYLCVDAAQTQRIAALYVPHYTQVLVVVNSQVYAGGGGPVASVTRNPAALPQIIHELGHSFAGLGDEYVDGGAAALPQNAFREGWYRNGTAYTDRERIPWKHWIEPGMQLPTLQSVFPAGTDPVGLFEGGVFFAKGVYRPTYESFMRLNGDAPVGPVNGEIWAQAVYGRGGAWVETAPAETGSGSGPALDRNAQPVGGWLFKAQPVMDSTICETRWYVNDVERIDQRGAGQLVVADTGALKVRVELVDLTGRVRQNAGVVSTLKWSVQ